MSKGNLFKAITLKLAVPILLSTGVWTFLGHQLIIILAGAGMALEHRLSHCKWWDKDKRICHGKFGVAVLTAGC